MYLILAFCLLVLCGCNDKPQAPSAPPGNNPVNDTLYLPVQPAWQGFNEPSDILVGREPFLYIADTKNNRIVMMDISGRRTGTSGYIKNPVAIAQDGLFDLLICGELDTVLSGRQVTVGAVFRINLRKTLHDISNAPVSVVYVQPGRPERRYTGITVLPGNSYLLARTGPSNASRFDPDDAVLLMSPADSVISRISSLIPEGNALYSIRSISSLSVAADRSQDFLFTQIGADMQYKVQWLTFQSGDISGWFQKFNPADAQANGLDLMRVNRFAAPEDITYDQFGNIYIADSQRDSIYKFTSTGREIHSFGGTGNGNRQFSSPRGIAWFNKTLYVADSRNNRIMRYRLSTDQ
jgi:hypothetical protein